jgi:Fur family ferric uptake transcriptional regulator
MSKKLIDVESARAILRGKDLRATPARIAVIGFLSTSSRPLTHQEVTDQLAAKGFDKSTIFRALSDLATAGLVRKMELGDHVWRFEHISPEVTDQNAHPHLLCVDCGSVQCLDDGQVDLKAASSIGPIEDVLLKGHCKDCQ